MLGLRRQLGLQLLELEQRWLRLERMWRVRMLVVRVLVWELVQLVLVLVLVLVVCHRSFHSLVV